MSDEIVGPEIEEPVEQVEEEGSGFEYSYWTYPAPRALSVHKYIDGYEFWLSPAFPSNFDYDDFDIHFGEEPWEVAVRELIDEADTPFERIEVGPDRVVAVYRERFNRQSDVITWSRGEDTETE